jgi:hypothetical protein
LSFCLDGKNKFEDALDYSRLEKTTPSTLSFVGQIVHVVFENTRPIQPSGELKDLSQKLQLCFMTSSINAKFLLRTNTLLHLPAVTPNK